MTYICYKRFKGRGIAGDFNIPYGTVVTMLDDMIYAPDGRCICARTSENGWNHFRPNTPGGAVRQEMLNQLYRYYERGGPAADFDPEKWPGQENAYWKNLLRTMPDEELAAYYDAHIKGETKCIKS